ncbi:HIT-like domain-containing protein [Leptodontidium sp. MPI-SDFR-AT-0119]|nr:HIT-like domain-containing protein [Leptodontidium sp. MPI-SDFR-AT-0119]
MATLRNLPALVRKQFISAQENGDLTFYATRVSILHCSGLPFQLRFSPALANKPKSNKPKSPSSKPFDPFENPPAGLLITSLPPSHFLVLNKFPVIPDHFILATKEFKQQTDLLEKDDLEAAYACLKAYKDNGEELFGFFNSGEHSGASQPHRHIQFLPIESMRSGIEQGVKWEVLVDSLVKEPRPMLPFSYFSAQVPENASAEELYQIYIGLHARACQLVKNSSATSPITEASSQESSTSYNLGFTDRAIVLCPRASEGLKIEDNSGNFIGPIALNGTVIGGTLLVKSEEEWDVLRNDESKLTDVLQAIGLSPTSEQGGRL